MKIFCYETMTSFLTSLYLLSFKQSEPVHTFDIDCVKIYEKDTCNQGLYSNAKREYFRSSCAKCKQQWGLKRVIKCVDKLFKSYKCLFLSWDLNQPLIVFFSNGSIVSIELNDENNSLIKIEIDDYLCGKFIPSRIVDVLICENHIFITYLEPKLTLIHINHDSPSFPARIFSKKKGKVVGFEPKIVNIDLLGPCSKSLERKLSLNSHKDFLLIWWKFSADDVWPWTPVTYSTDRINMLVYSVNGYFIEILCTAKVQGQLVHANFSKQHSNQIFTLEEVRKEREVIVNVCIHEIIHGQCQLVFMAKLPLRGNLICFDWSSSEDKLLASDSDCVLLIYDIKEKTTIATDLSFLPRHISWHPQNCVALVIGTNDEIRCFDSALTCIRIQLYYTTSVQHNVLELNCYLPQKCVIQKLLWQKSVLNNTCLLLLDSELSAFMILKFSLGCISKNNLTALELISQYLKNNCIDEAILLLRTLSWCHESELKFQCLSKIANFLFRRPLNFQMLAGLELALGSFYRIVDILPRKVVKLYQPKIHQIARRFFHHLLRHHQFRKAFLLAVDLESQDLFLDLYHVAKQKGENVLALVAFHKAEELDDIPYSYSDTSSFNSNTESSVSSDNEASACETVYQQNELPKNSSNEKSYNNCYWLPQTNLAVTNSKINLATADEQSRFDGAFLPFYDYIDTCNQKNSMCNVVCSLSNSHAVRNSQNASYPKLQVLSKLPSYLAEDSCPIDKSKNLPQLLTKNCKHSKMGSYENKSLQTQSSLRRWPQSQLSQCPTDSCTKESYYYSDNIHLREAQNSENNFQNTNTIENRLKSSETRKDTEEESEEVEDTKIKLVHFGII